MIPEKEQHIIKNYYLHNKRQKDAMFKFYFREISIMKSCYEKVFKLWFSWQDNHIKIWT